MLRPLVWIVVAVGLAFLSAKFAVWQLLWQLTIIFALGVWVALGVWMLARAAKARIERRASRPLSKIELLAAAERQKYAAQYGEKAAAAAEREEPTCWIIYAARQQGQK